MHKRTIIILLCILIHPYSAWPPEYSIDLNTAEEFIINDPISEDDVTDIYQEEELIQEAEAKAKQDREKYYRLHKWANNNQELEAKRDEFKKETVETSQRTFYESYVDDQDAVPWQAGFVDNKGRYIHRKNEKVYYLNKQAKDLIKLKMDERPPRAADDSDDLQPDYKNLESEYEAEVKAQQTSNETVHLNDTKEEETAKESLDDIIGGKAHLRNCTDEEKTGIGLTAVECFWSDIRRKNMTTDEKPKAFKRVLRIVGIWFAVYFFIAVPCFCSRGWCCCCCKLCCKFCRPEERIEEAKTYLAKNPVGVLHTKDGFKETFKPTNYEKYAQKQLDKAVMKL